MYDDFHSVWIPLDLVLLMWHHRLIDEKLMKPTVSLIFFLQPHH